MLPNVVFTAQNCTDECPRRSVVYIEEQSARAIDDRWQQRDAEGWEESCVGSGGSGG